MSSEKKLIHPNSNTTTELKPSIKTSDYKVQCSIVKHGLTKAYANYYLCECDPERKNPICENCFKECHKGSGHAEIKMIQQEKICMCGIKSHQPFNENENLDNKYSKKCLFGEWANECKYKICFKDKDNNIFICLLCKNICYKNYKKLIKINIDEEDKFNNTKFECQCTNSNHNDIRIMFRKFKSISKGANYYKKYNFDGFSIIQLFNLITRGEKSFNNIFHSFKDKISDVLSKIKSNPKYRLEEFKNLNDLHLTSQILSNFAIKSKNVYFMSPTTGGAGLITEQSNKKVNSNLNLPSFFNSRISNKSNLSMKKSFVTGDLQSDYFEYNSNNLYITCKSLVYFREDIKNFLTPTKYFQIMQQKFDYKSHNIWKLKYFLTNIFYSYRICRDFIKYPNLKYKDIFLLNPLQRLGFINNIKNQNNLYEYFQSENNILDNVLNIMSKISKTKEKHSEIYLIYNKLYKICQFYSKFSLFNHEQVEKFCNINNEILLFFNSCILEDKKILENQHLKYKVLSPMMKSIVYLAYYFNDQVLLSTLKNEKSVNFLHMKNEMCKLLMNNVENCLTWIQDLTPQYEIENYQKDIENKQMENKANMKKSMRTLMEKDFNVQNNSYEDNNMKKCLRNVVRCANSTLNLIFALADNYIVGMNRLIHKTGENQFNYVLGNFNEKEKKFIKNVENIFEDFEFEYFKQFDLYNENSYDLLSINLNELLEKVCVECGLEKNKKEANNNNNFEDGKNLIENIKLLNTMNLKPKKKDGSVYKLFFEHEKPSKFNENNVLNEEDINKILLNNTFIMPTIFKGIQILYNFFFSRNQKNKFFLDKELFNRILNLSYFYISNNLDNSYMFLTSDFLSSIELLNNEQLFNMLDVVEFCLKQIYLHSMEISSNTQIIHLLKISAIKCTKSVDLIDKILKIMQIIIHINFNDEQNTLKKLRKLFIKFYDKCKEANVDLKMLLNGKDKIHHYKTIKKLLRILNHLFEGNAVLEERRFIEELLNRRDFKKILRYNLTLDISIRTELLVLYRIINIDTIMMKGKINYYTSFLINEPKVPKTDGFIDNQKYLRFYENLITGGILELTGHRSDKCCNYLFELQNFKNIINRAQHNNYAKTKDYFERGILKPILVFRSKFSSLVFNCSGIDYLRYYLLLVFFLRLKIYIIEHKDTLNLKEERKKFKNPFKNKLDTWGKKKRGIINFDFSNDAYKKVNDDYENANNLNFKLVYFYVVNDYFQKNINKFINEPKYNKGMKDTFEKKDVVYEEEEIEKKKEYLESMNLFSSEFQKNIFEIIIKYYNGKTEIEKSSFFKILAEDNIYYNCKFRFIVVKNILFFMNNFIYESTYREQSMWNLFRLLQYDTSETQKSCLELLEKKSSLLDFNYFLSDFTLHVMTIFTKDLNPCEHMIRHDYFISLMIIKILKYFCEEHNQDFQKIFFIKEEEDGIVLHYNPKLYEIETRRPIFLWRPDESGKNPNILNSSDEEEETDNETLINGEYNISFNAENVRNKKPVPDEDCENFHEVTRSEENLKEFTKNKASVFEYCLSILGKIILVSNWINNKETEELDDYYYDLYFVILEFLIETIQGTRGENLQTVFVKDSNGKHLFGTFLLDINRLMIEENDDELSYQVRKDMMDFLMAFIEESATPPEGIVEISSVILPISILESILITMSKLYESKMEEEKEKNSNNIKNVGIKNNRKESLDNSHTLTNKNVYSFTPEMKKYFTNLFFNELEFGEDIKFSLANRMYQFFKFFGIEDAFKNPAVSEFYEKMSYHTETKIIKSYYLNKNSNDKTVGVTDPKFFDNYLCVSFFESITKMVFVYKVGNEKPVRVLFTLNPLVPLLSMNSKIDFIENVDRSNRYNKLFSLTESCDYFFEEVSYKQNHGKNNAFMRFITELDFYYVDFLSFVMTLIINFILVSVIKGDGERIFGDQKMKGVINGLGLFNLCINLLSLIFWCLGKFPLFYLTECQKILKQKENEKDEDDDENKIELNFMDKIYATYIVLVLKNKIFGFVWNISFCAAGFITEINFLYIFQLYSIITLSVTLKNLIFSVVYKFNQLMSVFYLTTILNFIFSGIAFFHFSRDFIREIPIRPPYVYPNNFDFLYEIIGSPYQEPAHAESECGTLLYCFATHLDYGMRFDGGIADRMQAASFTYKRGYYMSRFLYEDFYFICLVILMLNMIFGIIIEAFGDLRQKEQQIDKDKTEICFICGVDKDTLEKRGEKLEVHTDKVHNVWTYVDYMLGLRFVDIQETNAINSYVMENLERKELIWFPYDEVAMENAQQNEDDE